MAYSILTILLLAFFISFQSLATFHVNGDTSLIERTCKASNYYDLCINSLKSNLNSSLNADTKGLAIIMVKVGVANATSTNAYLSTQFLTTVNGNDTQMKKLINDCAKRYSYAIDALQASLQDLNADLYDYAYMHVMAAEDYPNVCRNNFRRSSKGSLAYPPELAAREDALKHICEVVLGIIDSLAGGDL
ncbi:OLC1v1008673C1 [Oldenlandia corymbosa var. corymbosa]|uniref:OLC1v1008673C1 n=1 Tax=Oldenlandia corymbosa var. corymbosa TaxID=529605 RepID=A0AAV1DM43_OLDCO|nr:OLC1v1008673C1 [Oldenlandia corymbosa var. corymbosa]